MGSLLIKNARLVLDDCIKDGAALIEDGRIVRLLDDDSGVHSDRVADLKGMYLSPGFVETHFHGGGMCDFSDGSAAEFLTAIDTFLSHGATTLFPTIIATTENEIWNAIRAFSEAAMTVGGRVTLPGLHLEGPYLSPAQKGSLPERFLRDPDKKEYKAIAESGVIRRWTLAPERSGSMEFIDYLVSRSIVPSIGHSDAEYSCVLEAFKHGCHLITHLYSAMSTIVRRGGFRFPGIIESAFCIEGMDSEIIADGAHIPPELLHMVWRHIGKDHLLLTTDASRCAGSDVKEATIGSRENGTPIIVEDGVAKMLDRSAFGGSIATPDRLVRVMWKTAGVPLEDAVKMYTATPSRVFGLEKKGRIAEGMDADLVCFDESVSIMGVMTRSFMSGVFA